ncbi:MAG: DUF2997 domain-containing protein [Candidatus Methanomethylicaceae archaeon]
MQEIVIKFSLNSGEAKVEARGFKGNSCADATKFLKDALGQCSDFQRKAEWYEKNIEGAGNLNSNLCG